jgi:hypothetical protein
VRLAEFNKCITAGVSAGALAYFQSEHALGVGKALIPALATALTVGALTWGATNATAQKLVKDVEPLLSSAEQAWDSSQKTTVFPIVPKGQ